MSRDKVTKKYHPIRFYVMNTDVPRILISHAASYWLGLVRVLCDNKAPRIKRQVASIDKKIQFQNEKRSFQDQYTKYGKQLSEETDDHRRRSLQERLMFQVQGCTVSRMPKYKEERQPLE